MIKFKNLEAEMKRKGWSIEDFAALFEVSEEEMRRWLSGAIDYADTEVFSYVFEKPADFLFMENFDWASESERQRVQDEWAAA